MCGEPGASGPISSPGSSKVSLDSLEIFERFAQGRHVGKMKGHVAEGFRRGLPLVQGDGDAVIPDRDAVFKLELLRQTKGPLKPRRAFLATPD